MGEEGGVKTIKLKLTDRAENMILDLLGSELWGKTEEEVVERLIYAHLQELERKHRAMRQTPFDPII